MLIQKINSFYNTKNQANSVRNQQPSYMSNIRGHLMADTVSFQRLNLEPKLLSPEVNQLLGKAVAKLESEQNAILEAVNAPIRALKKRTDIAKINIPDEMKQATVDDLTLLAPFENGGLIKFSKGFSEKTGKDYVIVESTDKDYWHYIKIQENSLEHMKTGGGKGVIFNNAFTNSETSEAQKSALRVNKKELKEENVSDPALSKGISELNKDLTTFLTKLLG